jgi:hypothetical protein
MVEKLATLAPGRLGAVLKEGLRGHHLLFEPEEIRAAFAEPEDQVNAEDATEVGQALLAICRDPIRVARGAVDGLSGRGRIALIRLYFRLLERAEEERQQQH